MRFLLALLVLFGGFVGYGAYRQHQTKVAQLARTAAFEDSVRRADSLQRKAEAQAAEEAQLAARRVAASRVVYQHADRPPPVKLLRPKPKYVVMKPGATNRRP